jgi:hypothetical protein
MSFGGRAPLLLGVLTLLASLGCRQRAGDAVASADTPALLRVIARSHRELVPPPATAEDRRRRAEWGRNAIRTRPLPRPKAADSADAAIVQAGADTAPPAGPMHTIRIVPDAVALRVGEATTLALEALDSAGRRTHVPVARWQPADPGIVSLDRAGLVTGTAPGSTTIDAWIDSVRARARVDVLPVVRGRLLTIDGEVPAGMQVRLVTRDFADSMLVGPDGRFEFRPSFFADTGELSIRAHDARSTRYHPMVARLAARETGPELNAIVVPTSWSIPSGTHAGVTLGVSADAALRRWRGTAPFARGSAHQGRRTRRVVGWAPHAFPLPVVFVRERSTTRVSAADSVAFWESVRALETQLGMTLFQAAETTAIGNGRVGVEVVVDPRTPPAAITWASWVPSGDLNDARVAVRSLADLRNTALIAHEMIHALGFGHALEWRSVMTRTASGGVKALTVEDVAYVQLILRVRAAQATFGAELGFLEAAEGERRMKSEVRGVR